MVWGNNRHPSLTEQRGSSAAKNIQPDPISAYFSIFRRYIEVCWGYISYLRTGGYRGNSNTSPSAQPGLPEEAAGRGGLRSLSLARGGYAIT